ncbi:MAG: hypothetical protein JOZ02_23190 [Acidobacteria bacterium]|nr:hypothetical protein [Acidobacteriota bacterium]
MSDGAKPAKTIFDPAADVTAANARRHSEGATLAVAVVVAVALGVACGVWINSLLASAAAAGRAAPPSRPPSEVRADTPTPPDKTEAPHESDETAEVGAEPTATVVESRTLKPAATPAPTPAGREAKTVARTAVAPEVLKGAEPLRGQARPAPCALYASASTLTIRGGGAAFLVLGGPGESGAVNVSTPSWADIAVFREGPAAGGNGWVRYTVKSVSKRPGLYTVHFSTHCGSQTVTVTVK